jgi:lipid-A-disaccharide synthase-like uncharacterized protein
MLIQYGQALGDYLYDVFVAKFDFWLAFGLIAQLFFTARFLVQWISSERAGQSVVPMGQALATVIYIRNIMLILKNRASGSKTLDR